MSTPPRRPRCPASVTRTSYQVGRPWMLEGKMLRGLTGMPMRRKLLANSSLAEAEPEPLTLANLTTKSLSASILFIAGRPPPIFTCSFKSLLQRISGFAAAGRYRARPPKKEPGMKLAMWALAALLAAPAQASGPYNFSPINQHHVKLTAELWNPIIEHVSRKSGV